MQAQPNQRPTAEPPSPPATSPPRLAPLRTPPTPDVGAKRDARAGRPAAPARLLRRATPPRPPPPRLSLRRCLTPFPICSPQFSIIWRPNPTTTGHRPWRLYLSILLQIRCSSSFSLQDFTPPAPSCTCRLAPLLPFSLHAAPECLFTSYILNYILYGT